MKTYNKTYLPDSITYNGVLYFNNPAISTAMELNNTRLSFIVAELKKQGRKAVLVNVLSNSLKGRTDLHGQPYKPTRHIFTTVSTLDQINAANEALAGLTEYTF